MGCLNLTSLPFYPTFLDNTRRRMMDSGRVDLFYYTSADPESEEKVGPG